MITNTYNIVAPIVTKTYGPSAMAKGLAMHLSEKIDAYTGDDRERMIMLTCWDWFSGGTTAEGVAHAIEEKLGE